MELASLPGESCVNQLHQAFLFCVQSFPRKTFIKLMVLQGDCTFCGSQGSTQT